MSGFRANLGFGAERIETTRGHISRGWKNTQPIANVGYFMHKQQKRIDKLYFSPIWIFVRWRKSATENLETCKIIIVLSLTHIPSSLCSRARTPNNEITYYVGICRLWESCCAACSRVKPRMCDLLLLLSQFDREKEHTCVSVSII